MSNFQAAKLRELISEMSLAHEETVLAIRNRKSPFAIANRETEFEEAERELLAYVKFLFGE